MVKEAIEQAIRKSSCTVYWKDGDVAHEFEVMTFWTDPQKLLQLPSAGGEVGEEDDTQDPAGGGGAPGAGGGGKGGGAAPGGPGIGGPRTPGGAGERRGR
jgi:hypothetical protein